MRLVVLSPPEAVPAEANLLNAMFAKGLQHYHLRKPDYSWHDARSLLKLIKPEYHVRTMVHQHHEEASKEFAIRGLHYPERLRPQPPLPLLSGGQRSTSFHQLEQLTGDWGHLDYAFLSPIFDSISKQSYPAAAFDQAQLQQLLGSCPFPVIALGGITPARVQQARQLGFKGVAVIGSVWAAADPLETFLELKAACDGAMEVGRVGKFDQ